MKMEMNHNSYDETLMPLLNAYRFNHLNIRTLIPVTEFFIFSKLDIPNSVKCIQEQEQYKNGCIFTLSGGSSGGQIFLFHTAVSSNEIRRRLALKAFL